MKALITGGSSGIGMEIAKELARYGYDIVITARSIDRLKKVEEEIKEIYSTKKINGSVKYYSYDLSDRNNCFELFSKEPDIDILVNNAGFGGCGYFCQTNLDNELQMIDTNIGALHILTKLYLKEMVKKDKGYILNVASMAGFSMGPLMSTYYATKNYVVRFTQGLKCELKKMNSNVRVALLCPGPVDTNFNKVANVEFKMQPKTASYVASYTVKQLFKNKFYIIPGFGLKVLRILSKFGPDFIVSNIVYNIQKQKIKKGNEKS